MTEPITTVVLAAGESKRHGDECPKQFKRFTWQGEEAMMWEHAIRTLEMPARVHLAMRHDHVRWYTRATDHRHATELLLMEPTEGQAHTLLQACLALQRRANAGRELLVVNCDQGFRLPQTLDGIVEIGRRVELPTVLTFGAPAPELEEMHTFERRYSFVDGWPNFRTAMEKTWCPPGFAMAGAYYFPDLEELTLALTYVVAQKRYQGREPYLSHVYERLPGTKTAVAYAAPNIVDWGTAETFAAFLEKEGV